MAKTKTPPRKANGQFKKAPTKRKPAKPAKRKPAKRGR